MRKTEEEKAISSIRQRIINESMLGVYGKEIQEETWETIFLILNNGKNENAGCAKNCNAYEGKR